MPHLHVSVAFRAKGRAVETAAIVVRRARGKLLAGVEVAERSALAAGRGRVVIVPRGDGGADDKHNQPDAEAKRDDPEERGNRQADLAAAFAVGRAAADACPSGDLKDAGAEHRTGQTSEGNGYPRASETSIDPAEGSDDDCEKKGVEEGD